MKKLGIASIIAVSMMALTACGITNDLGRSTSEPVDTAASVAPMPDPSPDSAENLYIQALTDLEPDWEKWGDRSVALSTGYNMCGLMDESTVADAMEAGRQTAIETGLSLDYLGSASMAAVVTLCPQHTAAMGDWVKSQK